MKPWQFRLSALIGMLTNIAVALAMWRRTWETIPAELAFVSIAAGGIVVALVPVVSTVLATSAQGRHLTLAPRTIFLMLAPFGWWLVFVWLSLPSLWQ